jgi:hypothetical protein
MADKMPDTLYPYRIFTIGGSFAVCSEVSTGAGMWELIKKARAGHTDLVLWTLQQNGIFERFYLDPASIVAMSDKSADTSVLQPNAVSQRKDRSESSGLNTIARNVHPSRVTIGSVATKPTGRRR